MSLKGQICTRGVWDETIPGIIFDKNGVSNYAKLFDKLVESYPRGETGQNTWDSIVKEIKSKGKNNKYDCIIGASGGTDSSYLLHLAKQYGLRPLAVNLDNGWNSDISMKNIKKMTSFLKIDLETYVINYEEVKDLLRSYMVASLPWVDLPTDLAIKAILYKIANRERIKFILRGNDFRSEGTQPTEWTYGDGKQLLAIHRSYGNTKLKTFPNYTLFSLFYYGFFKSIKSIYPYYFIDYNKKQAQEFLQKTYGWEYYGGHHHENVFTKFVISYWIYEKFGIDKRKISLSAQILSGEINRPDAIKLLNEPPYQTDKRDIMIEYVLKKLDFTRDEFEDLINAPNKSFKDYPSYHLLFTRFMKITRPLLKLVFIHKPQSVYKMEVIKE
jgi:N-acetyl sugar amidotransferase